MTVAVFLTLLAVRTYAAAAVGVQAVLDAAGTLERMTRPLGHDFDEPLPDCEPVSPDGYYGYAEPDLYPKSSAVVSRNEPAERPPEVDTPSPVVPSGGPLTSSDFLDAARYVRYWSEADTCNDTPENLNHLRSLADRLEAAANEGGEVLSW